MDFQTRVRALLEQHHLGHQPETHALDLVSEVGEVAKALLAASDYGVERIVPTDALQEELGDAFFSLIALAVSLDIDLETSLRGALDKYESRMAVKGHSGSGPAGLAT